MNNSVWVISYRNRVPFGFDCDEEEFYVIRVFSSYAKAFKYVQIRHPDIYRDPFRVFRNKANTALYRIEEVPFD